MSVAPPLSVTVNVTVYVPACRVRVRSRVTAEPVAAVTESHAYDAIVPSGSDDADPSTDTFRSVLAAVNDAVGF